MPSQSPVASGDWGRAPGLAVAAVAAAAGAAAWRGHAGANGSKGDDRPPEEALVAWARAQHSAAGGTDAEWGPVTIALWGSVRGLVTTRPVAKGEMLLSIPISTTLRGGDCGDARRLAAAALSKPRVVLHHYTATRDAVLLAVQLAVESRRRGSRWAPMIRAFPRALPDLPFYWPAAGWEAVRDWWPSHDALRDRVAQRHSSARHAALRAALRRELGDETDDAWHWAVAVAGSRAYGATLAPLLDMANHAPGAPGVGVLSLSGRGGVGAPLTLGTADGAVGGVPVLGVRARRDYKQGEEVYVSYDAQGSAKGSAAGATGGAAERWRRCAISQLAHYGFTFLGDGGGEEYDCAEARVALPAVGTLAPAARELAERALAAGDAQVTGGVIRVLLTSAAPLPALLHDVHLLLNDGNAGAAQQVREQLSAMLSAREGAAAAAGLCAGCPLQAAFEYLPGAVAALRQVQRGEVRVLRAALDRVERAGDGRG